ncbi:MAG: hypothetical protein A2Z04_03075 [Chloroflexi bacterium RBG_16_57_9]|nr:MAG: hypothetical protein A2Z04_03075 [Chloroflexi bacterium RBG_16_57_9]
MKVTQDWVDQLLNAVLATRDIEIACSACFEVLDQFVDLQVAGTNSKEILSHVQQHLDQCPDCYEEYEALLVIVRWDQMQSGLPGFPTA